MKLTYEPEVDAAYIALTTEDEPRVVTTTYPCDPIAINGQINLDFDVSGHLIGVEILNARQFLTAGIRAMSSRQ
jgi:uncharacterized protein YuzE